MTEVQRQKISQIRDHLATDFQEFPDLATDWSLLRFLRARNFDLEKTTKMLQDCFAFRRANSYQKALEIRYEDFGIINKHYASGFCNYDFEGHPVVVEEVTKSRPEMILGYIPEQMITDYVVQKHERLLHVVFPVMSRLMGKRVDKVVLIADLKDAGISKLLNNKVQGYLALLAAVGQNYYPDIMHKSFVLNAPFIFKGIWALVKGMLDERTVAKFCIEGGNGLKVLRKVMNIEFLPVHMGGKFEGPVDLFNGPWRKELMEAWETKSAYPFDRKDETRYFLGGMEPLKMENSENKHPTESELNETKHKKLNTHRSEGSFAFAEDPNELLKERRNRHQEITRTPPPKSSTEFPLGVHLRQVQKRTASKNQTMIGDFGYKMICFNRKE